VVIVVYVQRMRSGERRRRRARTPKIPEVNEILRIARTEETREDDIIAGPEGKKSRLELGKTKTSCYQGARVCAIQGSFQCSYRSTPTPLALHTFHLPMGVLFLEHSHFVFAAYIPPGPFCGGGDVLDKSHHSLISQYQQ